MNPFISFCLYVAARVFVQYLKSRPEDNTTGDALRFLLAAMNAMKAKNPLTESFLVQLDVDLESLGLRDPKYKALINGHLKVAPPTAHIKTQILTPPRILKHKSSRTTTVMAPTHATS